MKVPARIPLAFLGASALFVSCLLTLGGCSTNQSRKIIVGSKNFTEQSILGELLAQHLERSGFAVNRKLYLGGTLICHSALVAGGIDLYVEYTGTAYTAVLKNKPTSDPGEVYRQTRDAYRSQFGVELTEPLGFDNKFVILIRGETARRLKLNTLSEAAAFTPQWKAGFGSEFIEREDGFRGLASTYNLKFAEPPRVMDLGLSYRALAEGKLDLIAGDATGGLIDSLDLFILKDDKGYFPPYEAVPFVRSQSLDRHAGLRQALAALGGKISDADMRRLNLAVDGERRDTRAVVGEFLDRLR
jgi:osmoprotectant transport system substrate-binding protein